MYTFTAKYLSRGAYGQYNFFLHKNSDRNEGIDELVQIHNKISNGTYGFNPITLKDEGVYVKLTYNGDELRNRQNYIVEYRIKLNVSKKNNKTYVNLIIATINPLDDNKFINLEDL